MTRKRQNLQKANKRRANSNTTPRESQPVGRADGGRLPSGGSEARRPQRAGCTGQEAASPQRAGAAGQQPRRGPAVPRRARNQGGGERPLGRAAEAAGGGFFWAACGCPARALWDAPGGSQPAVPEPSAAPPPRTAPAFLRPRSASLPVCPLPRPRGDDAQEEGPLPRPRGDPRGVSPSPPSSGSAPDAEARPPSARGAEPQAGPPAAAGRARPPPCPPGVESRLGRPGSRACPTSRGAAVTCLGPVTCEAHAGRSPSSRALARSAGVT